MGRQGVGLTVVRVGGLAWVRGGSFEALWPLAHFAIFSGFKESKVPQSQRFFFFGI